MKTLRNLSPFLKGLQSSSSGEARMGRGILFLIALFALTFTAKAQYDTTLNYQFNGTLTIPYLPYNSIYTVSKKNGGPFVLKPSDYQTGNVSWSTPGCGAPTLDSVTTCGPGGYGLYYKKNDNTWNHLDIYIRYFVDIVDSTPGSATYGQMPDTVWVASGDSATLSVGTEFDVISWKDLLTNNIISNDNSISVSTGVFRVTGMDHGGYSSRDTIVVATICTPNSSTQNFTICEGNSVTINSHIYTTSGTYIDSLQTSTGCDSIITTHLTVNQPNSSAQNITACDSYTWFGSAYTTSGIHTHIVPNANGCDSTITLQLTINHASATTINASICQGNSVTIGSHTYTTSGTYIDTLQTSTGCDSIITTNLTVNPNPYVSLGSDTAICSGITLNANALGGTSPYNYYWNTGVQTAQCAVSTTDNYSITITDADGCTATDVIHVTINGVAPLPGFSADTTCLGNSTHFTDTSSGVITQWIWYFGDGDSSVLQNPTHLYIHTGTFSVSLFVYSVGCSNSITKSIIVNPVDTTHQAQTVCNGNSYVFYGTSLTTEGTYYHTLTSSHNCDSVIKLALTVNPVDTTVQAHSVCEGTSYVFYGASLTTTGTYYHTLTSSHLCDSVIKLTFTVNPLDTTYHSVQFCGGDSVYVGGAWQNTNGVYINHFNNILGCDSIITTQLTVLQPSASSASASVCSGDSILLGGSWQYAAGSYYDTLVAANTCDSIITTHLTVFSVAVPVIIQTGDTLVSSATAGNQWYNQNGQINGASAHTYIPTLTGDYYVIVTDVNACVSDTSNIIHVVINGVETLTDNFKFSIMPNPASTAIVIKSSVSDVYVCITSIEGRIIKTFKMQGTQANIDIQDLSKGIYFIQLNSSNGCMIGKLVKE